MATFHLFLNYLLFMYNYLNDNYVWLVNINAIGEAHIEAITMTAMIPFILYGLKTTIGDLFTTHTLK